MFLEDFRRRDKLLETLEVILFEYQVETNLNIYIEMRKFNLYNLIGLILKIQTGSLNLKTFELKIM